MQTLLDDIELDIQELKCLMQAIASDVNPALRVVAKRNIQQMKLRLDSLYKLLEESAIAVPDKIVAPVVTEPVSKENSASVLQTTASKKQVPPPLMQTFASVSQNEVPGISNPELPTASPVTFVASAVSAILAERIKPATELRHAISLNDSFRFTRELFGGDTVRMNEAVRQLGETTSLDEALSLFNSMVQLNEENVAAADFIELLKKYFS